MRYTLLVRKPDYHSTVTSLFSSKDHDNSLCLPSPPPRYTPGACIYIPVPRLTCIYNESSSNQMESEPRLSIPASSSPINSINFVTPIGRRHEKIDRKKRIRIELLFYNSFHLIIVSIDRDNEYEMRHKVTTT